jgi:hypothetical protein
MSNIHSDIYTKWQLCHEPNFCETSEEKLSLANGKITTLFNFQLLRGLYPRDDCLLKTIFQPFKKAIPPVDFFSFCVNCQFFCAFLFEPTTKYSFWVD